MFLRQPPKAALLCCFFCLSATRNIRSCLHVKFLLIKKIMRLIILCDLPRPASNMARFSARLARIESGMMLFAARLTSVASARSSPRTYRHTGTGSSVPYSTYLDGCAGPFSAAHGFRNFFCLTFATGPFRAVTAKPRCIGTAVPEFLAWLAYGYE